MRNHLRLTLLSTFTLLCSTVVTAQDRTLLISESGSPYTEQTWFAYGWGAPICEDDIADNWNLGKRIISAAYTREGWLLVMAKNTEYIHQAFSLTQDWPEEWIAEKIKSNYVITTISKSEKNWFVVMSQGSDISSQRVWRNDWSELAPWIRENKASGYYITDLVFDGEAWTVVMSRTNKYTTQGYFWSKSVPEMMDRGKSEVFAKGFNLHQVVYGHGHYVVVYGNYSRGNDRFQNLQVDPEDAKAYIRQQWNRSNSISYVGGGGL